MKNNNELKNVYFVEEEYDGHSISHIIKNILKLECDRDYLYKGEIISVPKDRYHEVLKFVTTELLRREPEYPVKWIDYYGKQRPYNKFCYGVLKIKYEYTNNKMTPLIIKALTDLFNDPNNTSEIKAPISVNIDESGYVYLEGDICYDNKEKFWNDLRHQGLNFTFAKRREYCYDIINANSNTIKTYADKYYSTVIDGEIDEEFDMQHDFTLETPKQKIKK